MSLIYSDPILNQDPLTLTRVKLGLIRKIQCYKIRTDVSLFKLKAIEY